MRIGILTFHYGYNYGAILQCVGLYKTLESMGHQVDVIDYLPIDLPDLQPWQGWGVRKKSPINNINKRWIDLRYAGAMRKRFDSFSLNNLTFSVPCHDSDVASVVGSYDALVVGSDQVWNRSYSSVTPALFLSFDKEYSGRRISYAACCGHKEQPINLECNVRKDLLAFDAVSVRNKVTFDWVKSVTGLSVPVVCDPTFLFDYSGMESDDEVPDEDYILVYALGMEIEGSHREAFKEIKRNYGDLPVIWVCPSAHKPGSVCKWADRTIYNAGPAQWLGLIENASFVYTDSFHGAVFSIKYEKPFLAYYSEISRADRLLDLAERYELAGSVVESLSDAIKNGEISSVPDYKEVHRLIDEHRKTSMNYLEECLFHG